MSKRRINIQTFAGLSSPALDDEDVPIEGASFASGLDPTERPGRLRGFHEDEATGLGDAVVAHASIEGGETIIYYNGTAIKQVDNVDGGIDGANASTIATVSSIETPQMVSDGERVFMARGVAQAPLWIGEIRRLHVHNTSLPSGYVVEDAPLSVPRGHELTLLGLRGEADEQITENRLYQFAVSWTYDGFQEGPLHLLDQQFTGGGQATADFRFKWTQTDTTDTPRRVTHINLYAIDGAGNPDAPLQSGVPRLLQSTPVDSDQWVSAGGSTVSVKSNPNWTGENGFPQGWTAKSRTYFYGGKERGETDSPYHNRLNISDFTTGELTLLEVEGNVYVGASSSNASCEVKIWVKDAGGSTIDSDTISLSSADVGSGETDPNGDYDKGRRTSFDITLGAFPPADADHIEVKLMGARRTRTARGCLRPTSSRQFSTGPMPALAASIL